MKNKLQYILIIFMLICLSGTSCGKSEKTETYTTFPYTHYATGGYASEMEAVILFEQSCSTFTAYQIAYLSCNCRDELSNYKNICSVELLNTKKTKEACAIRNITFRDNQGVWGDSNPNYYRKEYTEDYMHTHLVNSLIGVTKEDIDQFAGYGKYIDAVDVDAIAGATVSTSNMLSMLKSLFEYHTNKYYK